MVVFVINMGSSKAAQVTMAALMMSTRMPNYEHEIVYSFLVSTNGNHGGVHDFDGCLKTNMESSTVVMQVPIITRAAQMTMATPMMSIGMTTFAAQVSMTIMAAPMTPMTRAAPMMRTGTTKCAVQALTSRFLCGKKSCQSCRIAFSPGLQWPLEVFQ